MNIPNPDTSTNEEPALAALVTANRIRMFSANAVLELLQGLGADHMIQKRRRRI